MSDIFKEYKIQHVGLKKGIHEFSYELTESFFANFENAIIQKCNVQVNITFDNRYEPYVIEIDLDGILWSDCDRCTAPIPVTIHNSFTIYAKFTVDESLKDQEDDVEIIYLTKDDTEIDLTQFLYDFVHLSIPVHVICDKPGKTEYCDQEIIRLLEQGTSTENTIDPRWADLDKLKDKLN